MPCATGVQTMSVNNKLLLLCVLTGLGMVKLAVTKEMLLEGGSDQVSNFLAGLSPLSLCQNVYCDS